MKTVLVTGGVRGIGLSIALAFLQKGYRTCVTYSKDERSAEKARSAGLEVYRADVRKESDVAATLEKIGGVDVLVNNAVVAMFKPVWGEIGGSCESVYSASKGALIAFTKALASELGYSGIRVNTVSPGVIDTAMNARLTADDLAALTEDIPVGRLGKGEDVAKAVVFLEENEYVTGIDLPVNGGFSIV